MYCILKEVTGIDKDLVFDENLSLVNRKKEETDILIGRDDNVKSISYYAKHADKKLELDIPIKYRNMWGFIKKNPDWSSVLGVEKFVKMCKLLLKETKQFIESDSNEYYTKTVREHYSLFDEIQPAKIQEKNLVNYLSSIEKFHAKKILSQVEEDRKHFKKINYSLFNSSTGRMTVTSGPNLLTLKKENRNIFASSYENGKILEIDIKNLEPRILMGMFNKEVPDDIYTWIGKIVIGNENYQSGSIDKSQRDFIKELTFKILYGASMTTIKKDFEEVSWMYDIEDVVGRIKSNMGYHELAIKIKKEMEEGYFRNFYGRKLKNSSANINHYLQSTGVDVSMFCFSKINRILKKANINFKIIGFIHDAMLIDVDIEGQEIIMKNLNEKNIEVEGFNNKFPIIIKEIK